MTQRWGHDLQTHDSTNLKPQCPGTSWCPSEYEDIWCVLRHVWDISRTSSAKSVHIMRRPSQHTQHRIIISCCGNGILEEPWPIKSPWMSWRLQKSCRHWLWCWHCWHWICCHCCLIVCEGNEVELIQVCETAEDNTLNNLQEKIYLCVSLYKHQLQQEKVDVVCSRLELIMLSIKNWLGKSKISQAWRKRRNTNKKNKGKWERRRVAITEHTFPSQHNHETIQSTAQKFHF